MKSVVTQHPILLILYFLFLVPGMVDAQQVDIATHIHGEPQTTEFLPFADHLTVAFIHNNAAEILVLDRGFELISNQAVYDLGLSPGAQYLGMSEESTTWHLYFIQRGNLIGLQISRAGNPEVVKLEGFGNETFSGSFTFDGTMHLLRMSAWDNELRLVKFRDGRRVYSESFPIQIPNFVARAQGDFHKIEEGNIRMKDSWFPAKWYRFGDRLVFTLDEPGQTEMIDIDLLNSTVRERRFDWDTTHSSRVSNSLCMGTYLLHTHLQEDTFLLDMYETATQQQRLVCQVDPQTGITSSGLTSGWLLSNPILSPYRPNAETSYPPTIDEWLASLSGHGTLAIGVSSSEHGFLVQAGGISSSEEYGASGMIVDQQYRSTSLRFSLELPEGPDQLGAPVVFSSLRNPATVTSVIWQSQPVYVSHHPDGVFRIWR